MNPLKVIKNSVELSAPSPPLGTFEVWERVIGEAGDTYNRLWTRTLGTAIQCVKWSHELSAFAIGNTTGSISTIKVAETNINRFKEISTMKIHQKSVVAIEFHCESKTVYSISEDRTFSRFDPTKQIILFSSC